MRARQRKVGTIALALAFGSGLPVVAAEVLEPLPELQDLVADPVEEPGFDPSPGGNGLRLSIKKSAAEDGVIGGPLAAPRDHALFSSAKNLAALPDLQMAQFQLPPSGGVREGIPAERKLAPVTQELTYSYAFGSDSELTYRKDSDLDKRLRDNFMMFAPTIFGWIDYRPTGWLETRLEMTLEQPIVLHEEDRVTLPNGEIVVPDKKRTSLLVDQAYVTIKNIAGPFDFTAGRRNFEDPRLWLYDAALDAFIVRHRWREFSTEASISRENLVDLDVFRPVPKGRIDNYILYSEYRGIEDHRLAAYAIKREDQAVPSSEGKPLFMGVRAFGRPTDAFNYWADFGWVSGKDELNRKLSGHGFDVGSTYRFPRLPLQPSITLGYAFGTGDGDPNDNRNTEYRQTGLQSNETRFGGVTQFKRYGEAFDPEVSNIEIYTAGIGFRPAGNVFVDVVWQHFRSNKLADQIRNSALTALMNQDDTQLSKDIGNEIDLIVGFRNMFGFRRLGFEVRAGWFFPGKAYQNDITTNPDAPTFRRADKAVSILAVIIL
jgi:alginate production protein